jgi:hypothetical protein
LYTPKIAARNLFLEGLKWHQETRAAAFASYIPMARIKQTKRSKSVNPAKQSTWDFFSDLAKEELKLGWQGPALARGQQKPPRKRDK